VGGSKLKRQLVVAAVALFALVSSACGTDKDAAPAPNASSHAATRSGAAAPTTDAAVKLPQPELIIDSDQDSDSYGYSNEPDPDTSRVFGHAANAADARAMTALVKRYYAAAAASDGAAACPLVYSILAEAIPEDYGQSSARTPLRGKTCAVVISKLFKHFHKRLKSDSATLKVAAVRVLGNRGSVLLGFDGQLPKHYLETHRERGAWKIDRLLDNEQPVIIE
jgi:hypothetical protein